MEFQHDKSWEVFSAILKTKDTARNAWTSFISYHEQNNPRAYWVKLRNLNIEEEQTNIVNWLTATITAEPVPSEVKAIWFGLLRLIDDGDKNEIPTIYFGGADSYDKDDIDWASDLQYLPEGAYAQPGLLQEIELIAKTAEDDFPFLDWILPLAYCAFTLDEIIRKRLQKNVFIKNSKKIFVAVGHDSGDFIELTPIVS